MNYKDRLKQLKDNLGTGVYIHWKGKKYLVEELEIDSLDEKTKVRYRALYDNKQAYCREIEDFLGKIPSGRDKENRTGQKYRYEFYGELNEKERKNIMGYYVTMEESTMKIKKEDMYEVLDIICKYQRENGEFKWCYNFDMESINNKQCSIEETWADCLNYEVKLIKHNGIDYYKIEEFLGEKLGDEESLFNIIAKYCEGYVQFYGDDGQYFRILIQGDKAVTKYANIVFE